MADPRAEGRRGLLIVDAQNSMFDTPVYRAEVVLGYLRELAENAHKHALPVIYAQHCGDAGSVDEPGTRGWQLVRALAPQPGDVVVLKQHPDAFAGTPLVSILRGMGVTELLVAGFQSELGIEATCRRAVELGFAVTLVQDAHGTHNDGAIAAPTLVATVNRALGYVLEVRPLAALTW